MRALAFAHDWLTEAGRHVSAFALGVVVFAYCYEVPVRYFFGAPTTWSNELVSYAFCISIFMMMPHLTKVGGHVAVTIIIDNLPPRAARAMQRMIYLAGLVICLICAWISLDENIRQVVEEVKLMAVHPIPQWWISVFLTYGFTMAAIHFLRLLAADASRTEVGQTGRL